MSLVSKLLILFYLGLFNWIPPASAKEVRIGIYENEPNIYTDANGTPSGILIDILKTIAKKEDEHVPATLIPTVLLDALLSITGLMLLFLLGTVILRKKVKIKTQQLLESNNQLSATLDAIPDLLFEADLDGRIYGHHSSRSDLLLAPPEIFLGKLTSEILPPAAAEICMAALAEANETGWSKGKEYELALPQGKHWFELSVSKKQRDPQEAPRFILLSRDITGHKNHEARIGQLSKLYAALSQCSQAIVRSSNENELFEHICRDVVNCGCMNMAWIGKFDPQSKQIIPVSAYGNGTEYLHSIYISANANEPQGNGPTGTAYRENKPVWCQDFVNDPTTTPWHERGAQYGWKSSASLPLLCNNIVVSTLTLYSAEAHAFNEEVQNLLLEMATDISFALNQYANESHYRLLFQKLTIGFGLHDIVCDADGKPVDYRFVEINPAFEILTGLAARDIIGRTALEVLPTQESCWIELYGKVALSGESARFEYYAPQIHKHFDVTAYSPKHGQFVTLFSDTTTRHAMELLLIENERKYRELTESINDVIWTMDAESLRFTYISPSVFRLRGYTPEEMMAMPVDAALTPERAAHVRNLISDRIREIGTGNLNPNIFYTEEVLQPCKDGSLVWTEEVTNYYRNEITGNIEIRGVTRNIHERKGMEETLKMLSLAVDQSPNTIFITDMDGNIEFVNESFTKVTGYSLREIIGKNPRFLQSGKTPASIYANMWSHLTDGKVWKGELINKRKDGTEYVESAIISPVRQSDGKVTNYLAIKEDITEFKRSQERIEKLAHFDQLTGLPNRSLLVERFHYAQSMAQRSHKDLAVFFLDLDHFKNVNDTLGHSVGDQLLLKVSKRIKALLRDQDILSRQGGDEFVLVLPDTDESGAAMVANKLVETISRTYLIEGVELNITPSIGISIYPHDGEDFETLSKNADSAMYRAKQEGRDSFRFFTAEMQAHSARALQLSNALRHALNRNQLQLHYQPQLSIQDGRVVGAEALLRWKHPELGMISPAEFIPIAENSRQIIAIGEWVLRTALSQLKTWIDSGLPPIVMAVNLSAVQFRQPNLPELVTGILNEAGVPHKYLELELTEAAAMDDPQNAVEIMDTLGAHGIKMAIDDFGTGYSSLSYLKRFNVYKLKIDQSFVRDITDDPDDKAIVSAIINMASSLGMQTIAEGVETATQLSYLRLQGCDEVQGYYFSKPLPAAQFEQFLKNVQY